MLPPLMGDTTHVALEREGEPQIVERIGRRDHSSLEEEVEELPLVVVEGGVLCLPVQFEEEDSVGSYYPERALDEKGERLPTSYSPHDLGVPAESMWRLIELFGRHYGCDPLGAEEFAEYQELQERVEEAALPLSYAEMSEEEAERLRWREEEAQEALDYERTRYDY